MIPGSKLFVGYTDKTAAAVKITMATKAPPATKAATTVQAPATVPPKATVPPVPPKPNVAPVPPKLTMPPAQPKLTPTQEVSLWQLCPYLFGVWCSFRANIESLSHFPPGSSAKEKDGRTKAACRENTKRTGASGVTFTAGPSVASVCKKTLTRPVGCYRRIVRCRKIWQWRTASRRRGPPLRKR